MKAFRLLIAVVHLAFGLPAIVLAQDSSVSVSVRGGPSWAQDSMEGEVGDEAVIEWGRGYAIGGVLRRAFASGLLAEAEFTFLHNPARAERGIPIGGSYGDHLYLANIGYEFSRAPSNRLKAYLGFGLGLARVRQHQQYLSDIDNSIVADEGRWNSFAQQARAGVAITITDRVALSAGYRFIRINANKEQEVEDDGTVISVGALRHHTVEFGVSFRF